MAVADSSTDNETLTYTAAAAGVHFIRVQLYADAGTVTGNTYDMSVDISYGDHCTQDGFEENDTFATARSVSAGSYPDLWVCPSDVDDYYSITLTRGSAITVDLTFLHAEGDIDVTLLNPSGAVLTQSITTTDNEHLTYVARADGTYGIHVLLYGADTGTEIGNTYDMNVDVR